MGLERVEKFLVGGRGGGWGLKVVEKFLVGGEW